MLENKVQIRGRAKGGKGKIKKATGRLVGNGTLDSKGKFEKNLGKAQAKAFDSSLM